MQENRKNTNTQYEIISEKEPEERIRGDYTDQK